jgi:hypothetical protein
VEFGKEESEHWTGSLALCGLDVRRASVASRSAAERKSGAIVTGGKSELTTARVPWLGWRPTIFGGIKLSTDPSALV